MANTLISDDLETFLTSDSREITFNISDSKIRKDLGNLCKEKNLIFRVKYEMLIENMTIKCRECGLWSSMSSHRCYDDYDWSDRYVTCSNCLENIYFNGEHSDLKDSIKKGKIKCGKWTSTSEILVLKRPVLHAYKVINNSFESYRKKY